MDDLRGREADRHEVTVWACKRCGRTGRSEVCQSCGTSRGQIAESDAVRLFMLYWEPPTGWRDYDTMYQDWWADRVWES